MVVVTVQHFELDRATKQIRPKSVGESVGFGGKMPESIWFKFIFKLRHMPNQLLSLLLLVVVVIITIMSDSDIPLVDMSDMMFSPLCFKSLGYINLWVAFSW